MFRPCRQGARLHSRARTPPHGSCFPFSYLPWHRSNMVGGLTHRMPRERFICQNCSPRKEVNMADQLKSEAPKEFEEAPDVGGPGQPHVEQTFAQLAEAQSSSDLRDRRG